MHIELPIVAEHRLAAHAKAAGYDDVQLFVAQHLSALAHQPTPEELPKLCEKQLKDSLAMCDEGMAEAKVGGGQDAREALLELGRSVGFKPAE